VITKEPVLIRGFGLTLFRVWQYVSAPAIVIPMAGVVMKEYPVLWVQVFSVLFAIGFIALMTWGGWRKELIHGPPKVSRFAALSGFIIGGTLWGLMLFFRLKHGKLGLMDNLMTCNPYLFFWPLLFIGTGQGSVFRKTEDLAKPEV
jgi:hypothetical protein